MTLAANENQKTSFFPSQRKGIKPITVKRIFNTIGMIFWLKALK